MEAKIHLADQGRVFRESACEGNPSDARGCDSHVYTYCPSCHLQSCRLGQCYFCEQGELNSNFDDQHRKETHTHNEQFTCELFRDQESCSTRSKVPKEFAAQHAEQARVDQQVGEGRSPCAKELDHSSNAGFVGRLAGGEQGQQCDIHGQQDQRSEVSSSQEGYSGSLCDSRGRPGDQQDDHSSNLQGGGAGDHGAVRASGHRASGIWHAWRQDLRRDLPRHQVGHGHSQGGARVPLASEEAGSLGYQMPIVGGYKKDNIPKAKAKAASTGSFSMVAAEDFGLEDQSVSSQEMLEKDLEIARLRNMLSQMEKEKDEQQLILSRSKNRKEM